ncbi:hypothetical protein AAFP30_10975 [Gordonia sp. CPCC 205515]|uniref:hypothetical protein n=1 Tax=Gordonia sp. CPCC 205515 TaxID=3140791 RepID=UPI003AF35039
MTATQRIAGFAVGLAAVFGIAFGIGHAVGPWDHAPWAPTTETVVHQQHME